MSRPETWKPVPGYEGQYEVSDYGRVRSIERWVAYSNGRGRRQPDRMLKLMPDGNGYLRVTLAGATRHVGTRSQNLGADKHRDGTMAHAKLDEAAVMAFLARRAQGDTYAAIAIDYGVCRCA